MGAWVTPPLVQSMFFFLSLSFLIFTHGFRFLFTKAQWFFLAVLSLLAVCLLETSNSNQKVGLDKKGRNFFSVFLWQN